MKSKKLFFKDINGLRFLGLFFIFTYTITFLLADSNQASFYNDYLAVTESLKNQSISLFFVLSSFLLTAHGLRSYKYNNDFNLRHFYIRRFIRIAPLFFVVVLFYIVIHPQLITLLKISSDNNSHYVSNIFNLPSLYDSLEKDVLIYLFCIYAVLIIAQYYFFWGIVLKFMRKILPWALLFLFITGLIFKIVAYQDSSPLFMYLPYYFTEIAVGGYTAYQVRNNTALISKIKNLSTSQILFIYLVSAASIILIYWLNGPAILKVSGKLALYILVGFYIIEQTYSRYSFFKARNSIFVTDLGKISYSYTMIASILASFLLMVVELIEFNIGSNIIQLSFPIICFLLTWLLSGLYDHFIEKHFVALKKQYN